MAGNFDWYRECRKNAVATDTLESFQRCVSRVSEIQEEQGGGDPTTVQWFKPMCHRDPNQLEFQTVKYYGCIALHDDNWSVNT
ncbi:MAG: hypothetical protein DRI24_17025 [Deltaproteobacteria bacterium]|nr:MAG: hypothetical protein DRI24_17025 [Deltaproteobacteria bacterium]